MKERVFLVINSIPDTVKGKLVLFINTSDHDLLCQEMCRKVKSVKGIKVISREDVPLGHLYCGHKQNFKYE